MTSFSMMAPDFAGARRYRVAKHASVWTCFMVYGKFFSWTNCLSVPRFPR